MSRRRQQTLESREASSISSSYSNYGYMPSYNNDLLYIEPYRYVIPNNVAENYLYYPVDQYSRIIGSPKTFHMMLRHHYDEYNPYFPPISRSSTRQSHAHVSPRQDDRTKVEEFHIHHLYSENDRPPSKHYVVLPPIPQQRIPSPKPELSFDDEFGQMNVQDITDYEPLTPGLPENIAIERIRYYDNLRKRMA